MAEQSVRKVEVMSEKARSAASRACATTRRSRLKAAKVTASMTAYFANSYAKSDGWDSDIAKHWRRNLDAKIDTVQKLR